MLKKIASNTFSQVLSKALTSIIAIFLISSLTKYFSQEMYWQYNKIYNYLSIFTFLADLWLYAVTIREISKDQKNASYIIWNIMTLRLFFWLLIILLSIIIAYFIPWYNSNLMLLSIFIVWGFSVISLLNSSVLSLMQSFMKIEFSLFSSTIWKIANLLLIFWVIFILFPKNETFNFNLAFILIMISWLIGVLLNFLLNLYYVNKFVKIRFLFDLDYIKKIFFLSIPNWIAIFLSTIYFKVDIIILSIIESINKADISIALYSLPMKIVEVLMVIWLFFLNSILPSLSKSFEEKDINTSKNILEHSFRFLFSFWMFIAIMFIIFWKKIISILATPDYLDKTIHIYTSYDVLKITAFVLLFSFLSSLFNYIFISSKKEKTLVYINLAITLVNIIWNFLLIPKYSFYWSAIITLISQILLFLILFYYSRKIIKFEIDYFYIILVASFSILWLFLWNYILNNFSIWKYLDIFVYWSLFTLYFWIIFYLLNKKKLKLN